MEQTVLERFKRILEAMLADLEHPLRRRDQIAIESTPDAIDEVQNAAERELAIRQLEHDSHRLRGAKAALQRIAEGTYGQCAHCESEISIKRLDAVPWTPYCLGCQDMADLNAVRAEPEIFRFSDRVTNTMRAGQSITIPHRAPSLDEPRSESRNDGFLKSDLEPSVSSSVWPQKKPPASEMHPRKRKRTA